MKEVEQNKVESNFSNKTAILIVLAVGLIYSLPLLIYGFPIHGHDSLGHFGYYKNFSQQIWSGEFYPRWLLGMNDGFGSPTFFFYPPLTYYLTFFIGIILGVPENNAEVWQHLSLSAFIAIIFSGLACYWWLKSQFKVVPSLIGSIVYLILPYHIATDLYTRAALAELWAFVWMPLILICVSNFKKSPVLSFVGLSICYAFLIMTHLPTTLIFSIIPISYGLYLTVIEKNKSYVVLTALGMIIGVGIADIYLLPAMVSRNFIAMEPNPSSPLYYDKLFLMPFFTEVNRNYLGFIIELSVQLATMLIGIALLFWGKRKCKEQKKHWIYWSVITLGGIFMMVPLSKPIWQIISVLQSVQFPFRINTVLCLSFTALTAIVVSQISFTEEFLKQNKRQAVYVFGTVILCFVWVGFLIYALNPEPMPEVLRNYRDRVYKYNLESVESMPKSAKMDIIDNLIEEKNKSGSKYLIRKEKQSATIEVENWQPRKISLKVDSTEPNTLTIGQFYYPVWEAVFLPDNGQNPVRLEVEPSDEGLLKMQIPNGKGLITMELVQSGAEKSGLITTLASLFVLILGAFIVNRYKNNWGFGKEAELNG